MTCKLLLNSILLATSLIAMPNVLAQDKIFIEPLFEYPTPPEELEGLMDRSDYLMDHFWDDFKPADVTHVDQTALNDAFNVYTTAMIYASKDKSVASINKLLKNLKGNPVLLLQFTKAAEDNLYGPRANVWSDEAYIPFLRTVIAEKGVPDIKKQRYQFQLDLLQRSAIGQKFPKLRLTTNKGRHIDYEPKGALTMVEFGNPDCDDCRFSRLKLDMASDIKEMIEEGKLNMVFIVADAMPEDQEKLLPMLEEMPDNWTSGICYGGDEILDLRSTPSFYLIDKSGKIIAKNLDVARAIERVRDLQ